MLALGGRRLRNGAIRLDRSGCGRGGLKPANIAAARERYGRAQENGRSPKAAAHSGLTPSRKLCHFSYSYYQAS